MRDTLREVCLAPAGPPCGMCCFSGGAEEVEDEEVTRELVAEALSLLSEYEVEC